VAAVVESDVKIVLILTPPHSHPGLIRLALEQGKHVVVEKPFAPSPAVGRELADLAAAKGLLLLCAPFVQLAPTFRALWRRIQHGEIGQIHSARGLYGNAGSRVLWHHQGEGPPLSEKGIYNLKSLTTLLGPAVEILAAEATAVVPRRVGETVIDKPDHDVSHIILRHESGALSSIVSSNAIQKYRRPGLEIYGTQGTANLLGDDWDPRGFQIWRNQSQRWEEYEPVEGTWHWTDGLREAVLALSEDRAPLADIGQDIHILELIEAAHEAAVNRVAVCVTSRFQPLERGWREFGGQPAHAHVHDHTRPEDEQ
jgi:predicted dehydrogenase